MLIKKSSSESCRGWEGNDSSIIETSCQTLREYILQLIMDDYDFDMEESIEELDGEKSDFGWECNHDSSYIDYEGEEFTCSYEVFKPTQEYIDMLIRNL